MNRPRPAGSRRKRAAEPLPEDLLTFSQGLGHHFREPDLLVEALTHASTDGDRSYERLEFLGDRVLGLLVADMLYRRFVAEPEGALAKRYAALVREDTLAQVAHSLNLGSHLRLSSSVADGGGRDNPAILADSCEALLGALYLDGGLAAVRPLVERFWQPLLEADLKPPQDNKTALQEWAQGRGLPLPNYREVGRSGSAHEPVFSVRVSIDGQETAEGSGRSKRAAEQAAAGEMLERLRGAEEPGT